MKNYLFLLGFVGTLILSACTEKIVEKHAPSDGPSEMEVSNEHQDTDKLRAEKLVANAESLLTPVGFFFADEILTEALRADPSNRRAQFYKAFIAPFLKFRGFLSRTNSSAKFAANRLKFETGLYQEAEGGLKEFLHANAPPIHTEAAFQEFINELLMEQAKLIEFIKNNMNFVTEIKAPIFWSYETMIDECEVNKIGPLTYKLSPCSSLSQQTVRMNRGDWEALLQLANGMRVGMLLLTAYNMEGYFAFLESRNEIGSTDKGAFEFLSQVSTNFGKLNANNKLKDVMGLASDIYAGMRWLLSKQTVFCEEKKRSLHLFNTSRLCFKNPQSLTNARQYQVANVVEVLKRNLEGQPGRLQLVTKNDQYMEVSQVDLDFLAAIRTPVQDLKLLFPKSYHPVCGYAETYFDPTFGGTFPSGKSKLITKPQEEICEQI